MKSKARLQKIKLPEWVYSDWCRKENERQNACGVFTNIPHFKFASRILKLEILKKHQKQVAKNKLHDDSLPAMGIDMLTMNLVEIPRGKA